MPEKTLTTADNGKSLTVKSGDVVTLRLNENPTTGYRWAVASGGDALALQNSDYTPQAGSAVGGGGTRTLTFRAQKAGTASLQLALRREWEPEAAATERFGATVEVQD